MFRQFRVLGLCLLATVAVAPASAQSTAVIAATAPVTTTSPADDARLRLTATTVEARRLVDALRARPSDRTAIDAALKSYEASVVAFDEALARDGLAVGPFATEPRRLLTKARAAVRPRRGEEAAALARFVSDYNGYLAGARAASMMLGGADQPRR